MVSSHTQFYTFTHLKPNTSYSLSIAARNAIGQGPVAVQNATTLQMEKCTSFSSLLLSFLSCLCYCYPYSLDIANLSSSIEKKFINNRQTRPYQIDWFDWFSLHLIIHHWLGSCELRWSRFVVDIWFWIVTILMDFLWIDSYDSETFYLNCY